MVRGTFHHDSHGYPRAKFNPPYEALGSYLEEDVQSSALTCDHILGVCKDIALGRAGTWKGTGNAHTVIMNSDRVHIENEFSDEDVPCDISLDEFRSAVMSWKELVSSGAR